MTEKHNKPKFVVIGGGTGSFTLLSGLKQYPIELTALVNMADNGGSTGLLRDELGVLPPGDVRQCLVALSQSSQQLRDLFNYRFPEGSLAGHSFGNLFLSAVEKMTDNFDQAVQLASEVLHITGQVVPVTLTNCHLIMELEGKRIDGEFAVANTDIPFLARPKLWLEPKAAINPRAKKAILEADVVVIAPGNLYGSLAPALLVDGMSEALRKTKAKKVYVCNLVNKSDQTADFAVHNYAEEIERFAGEGVLDFVLYNTDKPSLKVLDAYALDKEFPVIIDDAALGQANYQPIGEHLLSHAKRERNINDTFILRSLIRHDAEAVTKVLVRIHEQGA